MDLVDRSREPRGRPSQGGRGRGDRHHHPKRDQRPLLGGGLQKDQQASQDHIPCFLQGKIPKWWMPDAVAFGKETPHTATGKIQKTVLREQFKDYRLPTTAA